MDSNEMLSFEIRKEEIRKGDYRRIVKFFKRMKTERYRYREKILLTFKDAAHGEEMLFENKSIRSYMDGLLEAVPFILYFITDYYSNKDFISACIGEYTFMNPDNKLDIEILIPEERSQKLVDAIMKLINDISDSERNAYRILAKYPLDVTLQNLEYEE